jgi:hypothetical protein
MMLVVFVMFIMLVVLIMFRVRFSRPLFQEKDDVDKLEYAESVKDEQSDEPPDLRALCRVPESITL